MAVPLIHSITNYNQTQRIVLLIDLNPLIHLQNPNQYLTFLLSTAKTFLSFPPLSSSLFSFKPFFSSLSPLLSSSKLSIPSLSLSFNHPNTTLDSLTHFLTSFLTTVDNTSFPSSSPRASHLSASMRQLVHDYAWEPVISDDSLAGTLLNCPSFVKSNLVILFSPVIRTLNCLSDFFDMELNNFDKFIIKFHEDFQTVNDAFLNRDIHFSWVDVKYEIGCDVDRNSEECHIFESGIRDLGWGFYSSDSIVLGSALVPFELIYPKIGISPKFLKIDDSFKSTHGQLNLEILDINGKPLECKCCDLELVHLSMFSEITSKFFWEDIGHGTVKIHIKAVQKNNECVHFDGFLSDPIIVREYSGSSEGTENCREYFEDRVLQILCTEMGELLPRKSVPVLQILFSFLCREDYWALVSLSNSNGSSLTGILKPFTVSSALLSIVDQSNSNSLVAGASLAQCFMKTDGEICKPKFDLHRFFGLVGSQSGTSPSEKATGVGDARRKKKRKILNMLQKITWTDFCKASLDYFDLDLEDVFFARGCNKSKKLKFLKCWLQQIRKTSICSLTDPERYKLQEDIPKEVDNRLTKSPQECEQPIASCSSVGEDSFTGASRVQDEAAVGLRSEFSESFLNDLPNKIRQGLESEEVDLASLANRLVNSCICWLYQKYEKETMSESQTNTVKSEDPSSCSVAVELAKLLLKDPKDLATARRNVDQSSQTLTEVTSEYIIREYELQIFFRMEMLQSEVGASFGEPTKQKFTKQICLLLENIQCHLQGGFFGDWSLDKYVGKIIKSRYCQSLGEVVQKIYERMDLLLFEDEEGFPDTLFSGEDSCQSWREKHTKDEVDANSKSNEPVSVENEPIKAVENEHESPQERRQKEHARKLIEAQERRQRARRFAAFSSWVPDLQRVWAPKQSKGTKVKSDKFRKQSKRRNHGRSSYETVCETPVSGLKRSCSSSGERSRQDNATCLNGPVSKALFQD